jgi:ATP-binding cassette subfamily F protein 3
MDTLIETVVEIDPDAAKLNSFTGNYSSYLDQREKRYEQQVQAYRNQNKEIEHIQDFIDRFRQVSSKAAQVQSRVKQLEKLERIEKPRAPRKPFKFSFPQPQRSNQKVMDLIKVGQSYGSKRIYQNLDLTIERGDRIVLVGPNGSGKSTLLKILAGILPIDAGKRVPGHATKLGYYSTTPCSKKSWGLAAPCVTRTPALSSAPSCSAAPMWKNAVAFYQAAKNPASTWSSSSSIRPTSC